LMEGNNGGSSVFSHWNRVLSVTVVRCGGALEARRRAELF
jgi:hypothetical protein